MNTIAGLDIGSHSIKLIELIRDGDQYTIVAAGSAPTPPKSTVSTIQADTEALAAAIKQLFKDTGTKTRNVNIALPESKVFTRVIEIPQLSPRELSSALKWEAEQYIPLPLDQVNVDYTVLRESKETGTNKMEVLLVAAPKTLVDRYMTIMEYAELSVVGAETEIISTSRAIGRSMANLKSVMVVSMGAQTSDIAILRNGTILFTRTVSVGGDAITRAIAQNLDFNQTQAEEYKRAYGLDKEKLGGKIVLAAEPVVNAITSEIRRAIAFYSEKFKDETIQSIIISGGTARLPGMVTYLTETINCEVQLANPWIGIAKEPRFNILHSEGANFCIAVGLALR